MRSLSQLTPFRLVASIVGAMFIAVGTVAVTTGQFDIAGIWILAVGLAAIGLAGLVRGLSASLGNN